MLHQYSGHAGLKHFSSRLSEILPQNFELPRRQLSACCQRLIQESSRAWLGSRVAASGFPSSPHVEADFCCRTPEGTLESHFESIRKWRSRTSFPELCCLSQDETTIDSRHEPIKTPPLGDHFKVSFGRIRILVGPLFFMHLHGRRFRKYYAFRSVALTLLFLEWIIPRVSGRRFTFVGSQRVSGPKPGGKQTRGQKEVAWRVGKHAYWQNHWRRRLLGLRRVPGWLGLPVRSW